MPFELGELLVMRREERARAALGVAVQVLDHRPGDREAIVGRGAAADLVEDKERARGGVVQDVRRLVHLDHEGRVAAGEVVTRADAREDAVDQSQAACLRRHPAAHLRHQRDQRHLPDVGRFARHVRAGDQHQLRLVARQRGVVGHEAARRAARGWGVGRTQHLLDHGVAALGDLQRLALVEFGPDVTPFTSQQRPAGQHVQFGQRLGGGGERRGLRHDRRDQPVEKLQLARLRVLLGVKDLLLLLAQRLGHVTFASHRGLAPDVIRGHQVQISLRDLDVVPEIPGVTDLQAADPGALLLRTLKVRQPCLVARGERTEPVQLGVVPGADVAPIGEIVGQFVGEGAPEQIAKHRQLVQPRGDRGQSARRIPAGAGRGHRGNPRQGVPHAAEFARVPQAVLEATEDPRDVAHIAEQLMELGEPRRLRHEFADQRLPTAQFRQVERGRGEPALQQARAGGRGRAVHRLQKGTVAAAAGGGEDLEIAQRGRIEEQRARAPVLLQAAEVLRLGAEILRRVMHERPRRPESRMVVCQTETLEVKHADRVHHGARAARRLEVVAGQFGHEPLRSESVQGAEGAFLVRRGLPTFAFTLDQQELGRVQRGEHRKQVRDLRIGGHAELPRGKVQPRRVQAGPVERERSKVVIARGVELVGRQGRAGGKDARELTPDELARLGRLGLVADRDLLAGREELAHVAVERVRGQAGHRVIHPASQREAKELGRRDCVFEEELEEIPQTKEQQGVAREPALHLEVLLHHGRLLGGGHGRRCERRARGKASAGATNTRMDPLC